MLVKLTTNKISYTENPFRMVRDLRQLKWQIYEQLIYCEAQKLECLLKPACETSLKTKMISSENFGLWFLH